MNHAISPNYLDELTLLCQDINCKEFEIGVYETRLLKALRHIAKRYEVIERFYQFKAEDSSEGAMELPIYNFDSMTRVSIIRQKPIETSEESETPNRSFEYQLKPKQYDEFLEEGYYSVALIEGIVNFDYKPKTAGDIVSIFYMAAAGEEEIEDGVIPIIPDKLKDHVIEDAAVQIAKLGLVKYGSNEDEDGRAKYSRYSNLLKLYSKDETILDKYAVKKNAPLTIKIFQPL